MFKKMISFLLSGVPLFAGQGEIVKANGIDIWYETFGEKENPSLLLIMGGCCQGVIWPKVFCERLAKEGFYVIRYDNRDTGLSTCFNLETNPYDLMDMAKDAIGLLDAIGVKKAHLFGVSMGGWLAQIIGAYYPEKIETITVMGSSCEIRPMNLAYAGLPPEPDAILSPPTPEYLAWMKEFMKLSPKTDEENLAQRLEGWNKLNGQKVPLDETINREIHTEFLSRLRYPQGIVNHVIMMRSPRSEELVRKTPSKIQLRVVILQGSEDPIFRADHGEALHHLIAGSEYRFVEGMGHVPNDHFFDLYVDILKRQASQRPLSFE